MAKCLWTLRCRVHVSFVYGRTGGHAVCRYSILILLVDVMSVLPFLPFPWPCPSFSPHGLLWSRLSGPSPSTRGGGQDRGSPLGGWACVWARCTLASSIRVTHGRRHPAMAFQIASRSRPVLPSALWRQTLSQSRLLSGKARRIKEELQVEPGQQLSDEPGRLAGDYVGAGVPVGTPRPNWKQYGYSTRCASVVKVSDFAVRRVKALSLPIVLGSTFELDNAKHGARLHEKHEAPYADGDGYVYSRWGSPTNEGAARQLAALKGIGPNDPGGSLLFSSGMAAITGALMAVMQKGDHGVFPYTVYGGTHEFLVEFAQHWGVEYTLVDSTKPEEYAKAIKPNTKVSSRHASRLLVFQRARKSTPWRHPNHADRNGGLPSFCTPCVDCPCAPNPLLPSHTPARPAFRLGFNLGDLHGVSRQPHLPADRPGCGGSDCHRLCQDERRQEAVGHVRLHVCDALPSALPRDGRR